MIDERTADNDGCGSKSQILPIPFKGSFFYFCDERLQKYNCNVLNALLGL